VTQGLSISVSMRLR